MVLIIIIIETARKTTQKAIEGCSLFLFEQSNTYLLLTGTILYIVKSRTFELLSNQLPMSGMSEHITCMDTANH